MSTNFEGRVAGIQTENHPEDSPSAASLKRYDSTGMPLQQTVRLVFVYLVLPDRPVAHLGSAMGRQHRSDQS